MSTLKNIQAYAIVILTIFFISFFIYYKNNGAGDALSIPGIQADTKVDYSKVDADLSALYENSLITDRQKIDVANFILNTENYKKHGRNLYFGNGYGSIYDASTYCENCRLVLAVYGDKSDENKFYSLEILVKGNGDISLLNMKSDINGDPEAVPEMPPTVKVHYIERGQSLYGIALNKNGHIKYGDYTIPAKISGSDFETNKQIIKTDFDNLLIFDFEKYNKVYFLAGRSQPDMEADAVAEYVFDKTNKSLIEAPYQKYFYPAEILEYSNNGRYLGIMGHHDDGISLDIFDIEKAGYIFSKWYEGGFEMSDFRFIDNENFTYKYSTPSEYANQEQTAKGNVHEQEMPN